MVEESRSKFVAQMREACLAAGESTCGVALFRGGCSSVRYDTDQEELFRQESYFSYLFGVEEPDFWGMVELPTGRATIFIPRLGAEYAVWMGKVKAPEEFQERYGVDAVHFVDELEETVRAALGEMPSDGTPPVHVLRGTNTDSGLSFEAGHPTERLGLQGPRDGELLYQVLARCRVVKSARELEIMRYTAYVASRAHVEVMRNTKPGMMEYQLESMFLHNCYFFGGSRHVAYTSICACGPNGAVLHYGHAGAPNARLLEAGDLALLDMGCVYHCYSSDITCTFPVSGTFTADQRMIYEAVLDAQRQIMAAMKPGVSWVDMHRLMWRVELTHLRDGGLLRGDIDEMLQTDLPAVFMPAGLGHLIGIDVHDVGGYLKDCPPRIDRPSLRKLRTARVLQEGMVLTVEPGCYFIDYLLDSALEDIALAKFIVPEVLQRFRGFGGVRLEDDVAVTATGITNFTLCPRSVLEVEAVLAGSPWPPERDENPEFFRAWGHLDAAEGRMVDETR